jgi:hypothetical protein
VPDAPMFPTQAGIKSEEDLDINQDGIVSSKEEELYEKKAVNRRKMAWLSLITLIISGFCVLFIVPETRLKNLGGLIELYFISLASITGAYVGISTWMSKR